MQRFAKGIYLVFLFLNIVAGCSGPSTASHIQLSPVRHTSDFIHNIKIFGKDEKAIEQLNEIYLQTGTIDTEDNSVDEPGTRVAIIYINKKQIVLKETETSFREGITSKRFAGKGYTVNLNYYLLPENGKDILYKAHLLITNNADSTEYDLTGMENGNRL